MDHGAFVDSLNRDGNTPLFIAVEKGASACVKVWERDVVFSLQNDLLPFESAFIGIWSGYKHCE